MAKKTPQQRLRAWRGKRSLGEAAKLLATDRSYLHHIENGKKLPGILLASRMEKAGAGPMRPWLDLRVSRELRGEK